MRLCSIDETAQYDRVYDNTVSTTCLPHTGFAGVWTQATHAEFLYDKTMHIQMRLCSTGGAPPKTRLGRS